MTAQSTIRDGTCREDRFSAILEAMRKRRSVRRYSERRVSRMILDQLFEAARWAPSNWNSQPWKFIVSDSEELNKRIMHRLRSRAEDGLKDSQKDDVLDPMIHHCVRFFAPLDESPVLVAACYRPHSVRLDAVLADYFDDESGGTAWNPNLLSLGMATQNLLLAAHTMGLGACFHSGPVPMLRSEIHELLDLPTRLELAGIVTIGWPRDVEEVQGSRKPLAKTVQYADATQLGLKS